MNTQIKASFEQIQIKGTEAAAQFTVIPGAKDYHVDSDTGEVTGYEDVPALPEGGEE